MFTVEVEKRCGCFTRSGMEPIKTFATKDDALTEAKAMAEDMNDTFCGKHKFEVIENGETFKIIEKI